MEYHHKRLFSPVFILILVIIAAGLSQGLLLPVLSIFMEERGISSSVNGLHAAALYIGSFGMSLVAVKVLERIGFKKLILGGMVLVMVALPLFPLISNLEVWFILRLLVGIGDNALHFASQLWMMLITPPNQRGRNISIYGMSYGIGFSIGPLAIRLLPYGQLVPFLLLAILFALVALLVYLQMPDTMPDKLDEGKGKASGSRKTLRIYRLAWFALIPSVLYGYMEAAMNSNFPIYGLRTGLTAGEIATLLPFFGIGGLILQLPLGYLSDRYGRKIILMIAGSLGGLLFLIVPLIGSDYFGLLVIFMLTGGLVGSFFSLGLAYAADILPRHLLPTANVIASIHFNIGSIAGPNLGGAAMHFGSAGLLFVILGLFYLTFSVAGLLFRPEAGNKS
ncbi:MFS transporter [Paenibacillus sp. FSL W8-0186]|uniref:MFS transporter n=1 Tax=Paenibacillus woosongensis TaxID=307580 RepID=A0ABQ4MU09_9BACL|nr:MFS transporter [Paenibacillus woosongensis]GIP59412.1 MFS transporter [Paenibacillus woosongensis]